MTGYHFYADFRKLKNKKTRRASLLASNTKLINHKP